MSMQRPGILSPEARLIFCCLQDGSATTEIGRVISAPVDWELLCEILDRESAAIHVWDALNPHRERIPQPFHLRLKGLARVRRFKLAQLERRLIDTVGALSRAGIDCLLLKGAALAPTVYGSFLARPMRDIDILVRPERVSDALQVLLSTGWASTMAAPGDGSLDHTHHLPMLVDSRGLEVSLELHRNLLTAGHPFALDLDEMWARSSALPREPVGARVFAPEDLLLHTCVHFAYMHMFRQGAWRTFRDLERIVAHCQFSWPDFVHRALGTRAGTCAYWTLRLASEVAGLAVPADALADLAPPVPESIRAVVARHLMLVLVPGSRDCPSIRLRRVMWNAAILPGWSGHGSARPWKLFTGVIGQSSTAARDEGGSPLDRPRWRGAWGHYLTTVLAGH